jgi:MFS family permease
MDTTQGSPHGTNDKTTATREMKIRLSTLWIFVMFNYLYCDVVGLMDSALLKQFLAGNVGEMQLNQGFLLGASILMEIPISMVLLSRLLRYTPNRWANLIAGLVMTAVQVSSLFFGSAPTSYYIFFSMIEITCTALIVWSAWKWTDPESTSIKNKLIAQENMK